MIVKGVNQEAVVNYVVRRWTQLKGERIAKEIIWKECWQAYQSQFGQTWQEMANYRSKRYLPLTFQAVESISSQYTQIAMPTEDFFEVYGRTPDDDSRASYGNALMRWQFYKRNLHNKVQQAMKQAAIFGNVPFCVHWRSDDLQIPDFHEFAAAKADALLSESPNRKLAMPTKTVNLYDGPDLDIGNIFDFVVERGPDDPSMAFRINRTFRRKAYLEAMNAPADGVKLYENLDKTRDTTRYIETSDAIKQQVDAQLGLQPDPEEGVDLLQAEGDFFVQDASGKTRFYKNHIAVIANKQVLLRFEPCPFLHGKPSWQMFKFYDDPNETYAKGTVETVLPLQDAANVRFNQLIEANTLNINTMWLYKEDGVIDASTLLSMPGGLIPVSDVNNVKPLPVEPHADLALQELGFIMAQFNQTTGADQSFTSQNYKKSATEVANQAQAASARDQFMVRHIEQNFLLPALSMWFQLNQQMMDRPTWIRIIGDSQSGVVFDPDTGQPAPINQQALMVTPDSIAGNFDVMITGSTAMQRTTQEMQATIQLFQIIMQSQAMQAVKMPELLNDMAKLMKLRNAWRWLKSPMEIANEQQQQQMAQQSAPGQAPNGRNPGGGQGGPQGPPQQPGPVGLASMAGGASPGGLSAPGAPPGPQPQ